MHCSERLFQMDWNRHKAAGTLAEVFDASQVHSDKWARTLDLTGLAAKDLAAQSPDELSYLRAYAAGVNSYLSEGHPLPVEYRAVGITDPEAVSMWQPVHSLAVLRLHTTALGGSSSEAWEGELTRYLVQEKVGAHTAAAWGLSGGEGGEDGVSGVPAPAETQGVVLPSASSSFSYVISGDRLQSGSPVSSSTLVLEVSHQTDRQTDRHDYDVI